MARMHARKKGKSGSTKPAVKSNPSWNNYSEKEVEKLVIKLGKENMSTSLIGMELRDIYGIPDVKAITKKSITDILKENKLTAEIPEDLMNLIRKAISITKHMEQNKQDKSSKRGLQNTESKILRLSKYYKKSGKLDKAWKYDLKQVRLFIE